MSRRYTASASVRFGTGELVLSSPEHRWEKYDKPPFGEEPPAHQVVFSRGRRRKKIADISEIASIASKIGVNLANELRGQEGSFATIVSTLAGLGRVVSSVALYSFLEEQFSIDVSKNLPRIEGGELQFMSMKTKLDSTRIELMSVRVNLTTLDLTTRPVRRR